jgi:hypothetical protein
MLRTRASEAAICHLITVALFAATVVYSIPFRENTMAPKSIKLTYFDIEGQCTGEYHGVERHADMSRTACL